MQNYLSSFTSTEDEWAEGPRPSKGKQGGRARGRPGWTRKAAGKRKEACRWVPLAGAGCPSKSLRPRYVLTTFADFEKEPHTHERRIYHFSERQSQMRKSSFLLSLTILHAFSVRETLQDTFTSVLAWASKSPSCICHARFIAIDLTSIYLLWLQQANVSLPLHVEIMLSACYKLELPKYY